MRHQEGSLVEKWLGKSPIFLGIVVLLRLDLKLLQWMTFFSARYNHDRAFPSPGSACN